MNIKSMDAVYAYDNTKKVDYSVGSKTDLVETNQKENNSIAVILSISRDASDSSYRNSLSELGFNCGSGGSSSNAFISAVKNFQKVYGLSETGALDTQTKNKISEAHTVYKNIYSSNALSNYSNGELDYIEKINFSRIAAFLKVGMGMTSNQAAGMMGNIHAESRFSADNAKNQGAVIDHDPDYVYSCTDNRGYGICQWTSVSRKQTLQQTATEMGLAVSDINAQLATIRKELNGDYSNTYNQLCNTGSIIDATSLIFSAYEGPEDDSLSSRQAYAQEIRYVFNEAGF